MKTLYIETAAEFFAKVREDNTDSFVTKKENALTFHFVQAYFDGVKVVYAACQPEHHIPVDFHSSVVALVITPGDENSIVYIEKAMAVLSLLERDADGEYIYPANVKDLLDAKGELEAEWKEKYFPAYYDSLEDVKLHQFYVKDCWREARCLLICGKEPQPKDKHTMNYSFAVDCLCGFVKLEEYTGKFTERTVASYKREKAEEKLIRELCASGEPLTPDETRLAKALRELRDNRVGTVTVTVVHNRETLTKRMKVSSLLNNLIYNEPFCLDGYGITMDEITAISYKRKKVFEK